MPEWLWEVLGAAGFVIASLALWAATVTNSELDQKVEGVAAGQRVLMESNQARMREMRNQIYQLEEALMQLRRRQDELCGRLNKLQDPPMWPVEPSVGKPRPEVRKIRKEED